MKKMYSRITAALTASAAAMAMCHAFPASAAETIHLMGDMDGDLKITALDAQVALQIYAESIVGNTENTANTENSGADIDMNGEIEATDAQNILRYYCQTLVGEQPLWADYREVSYRGGDGSLGDPNAEQNPFTLRGMYLEIGCAQGAPGEEVSVPVYISGVDKLAGFQFFIKADDRLTPTTITSTIGPEAVENGDIEIEEGTVYKALTNPEYGAIVWAEAYNINPRDGFVIGNFNYVIPEDAEPGTVYQIRMNTEERNKFIPRDEYMSYEFTLLEGVVVVE